MPRRLSVYEEKSEPELSRVTEPGETHIAVQHWTDRTVILTHSLSAIHHTDVTVAVFCLYSET